MAYVFRLHRGDDLLGGIQAAVEQQQMAAGYIACCVGCVSKARLRDATGVDVRELNEPLEIVSMTGTVSTLRCHLHVSFSRVDLSTVGGHLLEGCIVNTTAEIVLVPLPDVRFDTQYDAETGYNELVIRPMPHAGE